MSRKRPANLSLTVREAGYHIPPRVNSLSEYDALTPDAKFGLPVKRSELTTLPKRLIKLPVPHMNAHSYCSHLDVNNGKMECNTGTCYLLLFKDGYESIQSAANGVDKEVRVKAWPRQWYGPGYGRPIQTPEMASRGEYIKCVERDDHKMSRFCACPSSLYCGYCECSSALRDRRLEPERSAWRRRQEKELEEETKARETGDLRGELVGQSLNNNRLSAEDRERRNGRSRRSNWKRRFVQSREKKERSKI
ncbi:hypothetical protein K491DRAFT_688708 [Lophiostoma macrostomum CBS 122681]|uniref:Uncharacterized protein n=1 Tax=Lophiostoma macrostomum CBS 122681 TaxID=1314788 RepID=A0A6A6TJA0_9PLEO|nr:hypothetical protein K491DRAFT_688708 [Lophiostoma macrostomum CBS 122681]